ncbi:hypothetical protein ACIPW9_35935 [Streptomyces sp. NPDC090052]|uniref:hypothetical protein n=1 Tax=Streptomyces sp. NPDC090052 TaxID=3365931 RepID=UPI00380374D6
MTGGPYRGRGRPPLFDDAARERYLALVASGLTMRDAAAGCPVAPTVVTYTKLHHAEFAAALTAAREKGKRIREDAQPHGESRYNHGGCRCGICRKAATAARAGRRAVPADEPSEVIDMPQLGSRAPLLVLAVAS